MTSRRERKEINQVLPHMKAPLPYIAYRLKHRWQRFLNFSFQWFLLNKIPWLANKVYKVHLDERFVEYAFVHQNISSEKPKRILDVGCWGSLLPLQLASLGHDVYGIDLALYPFKHPNLSFIRGDICDSIFQSLFDVITIVSTLEHIGLKRYADNTISSDDQKAMKNVKNILKNNGKIIITVPFGISKIVYHNEVALHRVYDSSSLAELLSGLKVQRREYMVYRDGNWFLASLNDVEDFDVSKDVHSLALIVATKDVDTS